MHFVHMAAFFVKQPFNLADKMLKADWNDELLLFNINFSYLFLCTLQFSRFFVEHFNAILNTGYTSLYSHWISPGPENGYRTP